MTEPVKILIGALGGEGGGVLSNWLIAAASLADLPVQGTSIPGVAQRTGATTYYLEVFPRTNAVLGGRRPLLALYPGVGDVDLVVASELLEAARAAENGFVSPTRTTLIAATHRVYAIYEKIDAEDGRVDAGKIIEGLRALAQRPILFDLTGGPATARLPLNAVLLGVVAATGLLPIGLEAYRAAIAASGIAVDANLAGFSAGLAMVDEGLPAADPRLPAQAAAIVAEGVARLTDFQSAEYAALYVARLGRISALPGVSPELVTQAARYLAIWMGFEDVIRVAQLKSRASRFERLRREVAAKPEEPVVVREFFKPGLEEIAALMPPGLGRRLEAWGERRDPRHRLHFPLKLRTSTISGFLRLWLLARLRFWRPRSFRYAWEQALIERWLDAVVAAFAISPGFGQEVCESARLLKGYSDTQRRGRQNFLLLFDSIALPAIAAHRDASAAMRRARETALANPDDALQLHAA